VEAWNHAVRHVTATPAYSSDETAQIHDLTPPFHSKIDNGVLQTSTFGKITSFRRGIFIVGRKNQFPVRGRKEWRRKMRPNTHENKQRATYSTQHRTPWHHKHGYHDLIATVIRILFTQRWGCGSNDESISQPVSPTSQQNILHPLIHAHASIQRFSHCSCFSFVSSRNSRIIPDNQIYKTVHIFLNSLTPFTEQKVNIS